MTEQSPRSRGFASWLRRYAAEVALAASVLWVLFLPLLYGLLVEPLNYRWGMAAGAVALAVAMYLLGWIHPAINLLLGIVLGAFNVSYAHTAHAWGIGNLEIRVETAMDSSPRETMEFLQQFVLHSKFGWGLMGYLLGILVLGVLYWYLWRKQHAGQPKRAWRRLGAAFLGAVVVLAAGWPLGVHAYPGVDLGVTTYKIYTRVNPVVARTHRVRAMMEDAPPLDCNAPYDKIVFVLGESANRDYMHAYGYKLPTTPFLDSLEDKVQVRAISPANQTMSAVPIIMTAATVHDFDAFYTHPSIISDMKRCGYETFWFSNQLRYSPYTSTVSSIAGEADHVHFVLEDLHPDDELPDGIMFQLFSPNEIVPGKKQAFFFHQLGSHYEWEKRYPPDKALIANPKDLIETYVNTIYYTDYFLSQVFSMFQERSENMLFIYVSDHGEWMMPDRGGHASAHPFQEEYRVPLIFWATNPGGLQPIAQATEGRLVNTENLDLQVRFLLGLEDEPHISYSTKVLSLSAGRIREYLDMPDLGYHETP